MIRKLIIIQGPDGAAGLLRLLADRGQGLVLPGAEGCGRGQGQTQQQSQEQGGKLFRLFGRMCGWQIC